MPCRWKSKGFSSGDDCVAKMQGKVDNPDAFCYGPAEDYRRHPDFEKIYRQFHAQIHDDVEANRRYFAWIDALNLDESKPYGDSMREQFKWIRRHVDFEFWKQDNHAKYWRVEAGFPVESMNRNIYTLEELKESARTLEGQPVNLNHKFPLPTIEVAAAKFEDGVVEAVLRVPNTLMCPICDKTKTINNLIESGGIVNVSLEASCSLQSDDPRKCEGMRFTGLSLLSNATLPGIPLTRLMPLEHIMVEALTSTRGNIHMKPKKRLRIKAKVKEQADDCKEGEVRNPETGECEPKKTEQGQPEPTCPENHHFDATQHKCVPDSAGAKEPPIAEGTVDVPEPAAGPQPDAEGQCDEGQKWSDLLGKCVPIDETPEQVPTEDMPEQVQDNIQKDLAHTDLGTSAVPDDKTLISGPAYGHKGTPTLSTKETTYAGEPGAVKDLPHTIMPEDPMPPHMHDEPMTTSGPLGEQPIEPQTAKSKPGDRHLDMPEGDTNMQSTGPDTVEPEPPHDCQPDHHWDNQAHACVPDTDLTEAVRRINAELQLAAANKNIEHITNVWQKKYIEKDTTLRNVVAAKTQSDRFYASQLKYEQRRNAALTEDYQESEIARREVNNRFAELDRQKRKIEGYITDLQLELEELKKKYHGALSTNLQLTRKNTQLSEDYLVLAKDRDAIKDKLEKSRVLGKKILKLKA